MTAPTGTTLAHDRAGVATDDHTNDAATVVLIHAGITDRHLWDPHWDALTGRYDSVRVDLRGFGESTEKPTASWAAYADVARTLDDLGVERAHVVGCSFGAGVATEIALARPDVVASLLLVSPGGALISEMTPELRTFFDAEHAALDAGDLDAATEANLRAWVDSPRRSPDDVDPHLRATVGAMQRRAFEITADWDDLEVELDPPAPGRYAEIAVPTLVLSGDLDLDAVQATADEVVAGVTGARRVSWPGTAHLPSLERPAEFSDLMLDWLAENRT